MRMSDWSSDVCASDLLPLLPPPRPGRVHRLSVLSLDATHPLRLLREDAPRPLGDGERVGSVKSVSVRVDLGGPRVIKHTTNAAPVTVLQGNSCELNSNTHQTRLTLKMILA